MHDMGFKKSGTYASPGLGFQTLAWCNDGESSVDGMTHWSCL